MKSFKDYLTESKKVYEFKVKIAGECPKDCAKQIKAALAEFHVDSCSSGKSTPIQESQVDFPEYKNVGVTIFDVALSYPTTSFQLRNKLSEALGIVLTAIKVRNLKEEEEFELNHANDSISSEALLGKEYENNSNQDKVGDKQVMSLLKDLQKSKNNGEQYKGVNDQLLAKSAPTEKASSVSDKIGNNSPLGKVSNPDPRKGK